MIRSFSIAILTTSLLAVPSLAQTTWHVDASGTPPGTGTEIDPYTSLQDAIARPTTVAGDTVLVAPGTYVEQLDFLGKDLVVRSKAGAATTIVDGGGVGPVVTFASGETAAAVLDGFTIANGDSVDVVDPAANPGGGVHCDGTSPTLVNLVVEANHSLRGGGLRFTNGSAATLTDSVVRDNNLAIGHSAAAVAQGGGMWSSCDSAPVVLRTSFIDNRNASGGGAYGSGTFLECLFDGNGGYQGGGIHTPPGCSAALHDSTVQDNLACIDGDKCASGGGIYGPAQVYDSEIIGNVSVSAGGGVDGATLTRTTLRGNRATAGTQGGKGGGAANATLIECVIEDNEAVGTSPFLTTAAGLGGGIWSSTATDCVLRGNLATNGRGGGAYASTLLRCEVVDNEATSTVMGLPSTGGGVGLCTSTYVTIHGNHATNGAGVSNGTSVSCTIVGNVSSSGSGGGVEAGYLNQAGSALLRNTIVWENGGAPLLQSNGTITATYCDVQGGFAGTGNFDADPLFWDAAGGDFHLQAGSPCIDTGNPAETDPGGGPRDVGAFPYDPTWAPGTEAFCFGNATDCPCGNGGSGDGGCDLPQATGGVTLAISGFAPDFAGGGSAHLVGTGFPPASSPTVVAIRSPSAVATPVALGDGLRCIATSGLVRLGASQAVGGASDNPIGHGAGAGTFVYQLWFRSVPSTFCNPTAAFNLSNGLEIAWP